MKNIKTTLFIILIFTATFFISVANGQGISGANQACAGVTETYTYTGSAAFGNSYVWSISGHGAFVPKLCFEPGCLEKEAVFTGEGYVTLRVRNSYTNADNTYTKHVTINSPVTSGDVNNDERCGGGPVQLSVSNPNGSYKWYLNSSGGAPLSNNASTGISITGIGGSVLKVNYLSSTKTYWVEEATCAIGRVPVKAIVHPLPAKPTVATSSICYGTSTTLYASGAASGESYEWYDGINLVSSNHSFSTGILTASKTYNVVKVSQYGCKSQTLAVTVTINPPLQPGSITNAQTICYNGNPSTLGNGSSASNGIGGYTYQWQHRAIGGGWSNISGATSSSYNPPVLTSSKEYIRRVISCNQTKYSNVIRITVKPELNPGSITNAQTICYNGYPSTLGNGSSASNGVGGYTYQWQHRAIGGGWSNISGATSTSYNPPVLTSSKEYIRRVISCNQTQYSNVIRITVKPELNPGSITNAQTICYNGKPSTLGNGSAASNGIGGYTYQWQHRAIGGGWSNISGATSTSYNPPVLISSREYRRRVISCNQTAYSNEIKITVSDLPNISAGQSLSFYEFEGQVTLQETGESPAGGTFSGLYVSNNKFNTTQSGLGSFSVDYSYTNSNGCTATGSKSIQVLTNPSIQINGSDEIVWGESRVLTILSGFSNYQWYRNNEPITGAINPEYEVNKAGQYKVRITSTSGGYLIVEPKNIFNKASQQKLNFVQTITYKIPTKDGGSVSAIGQIAEEFTYFDGLGRPMQSLQTQASPNRQDMIKPIQYDAFGRVSKDFLPYVGTQNSGEFDPLALRDSEGTYESSNQYIFYNGTETDRATTDFPYSEVSYEASPLNRPIAQYAPGEEWAKESGNKPVTTEYLINTAADGVIKFNIANEQLEQKGVYGSGVFNKQLVTDENGNQSITFTDVFGKTILKRNIADGENFDTYYVYNLYDNLSFVVPPEAINQLESTNGVFSIDLLSQFVFQYKYDYRNRMIWKKVPGAEPVVMIYDDRDRLVLTQDGNQANDNLFSFTKYDALNRPIMTGEKQINNSIPNLRNLLSGSVWLQNYAAYETLDGDKYGYTSNSLPKNLDLAEINTVTYYDNYNFRNEIARTTADYDYESQGLENAFTQSNNVKGQVTGGLTRVLNSNEMLASVNYYDERYRLVQSINEQNGGNMTTTTNAYDFVGNVKQSQSEYMLGSESYTISESYEYDHMDRLMSVSHQIDSDAPVVLIENQYNALGELITKNLHEDGDGFAQSVDYRYNIRGWLTRINNADLSADNAGEKTDLFGMELGYTDNFGLKVGEQDIKKQFNGNIAAVKWGGKRNDAAAGNIVQQNAYGYGYDGLNRITEADFYETASYTTSQKHQLKINEYDRNGNIKQLQRRNENGGLMDDLSYSYNGNRLDYVTDAGDKDDGFKDGNTSGNDYSYDDNGNMIEDANKKITTISYNYLNLPKEVLFENGNKILYIYSASGTKLRQEVYKNNTLQKATDYIGSLVIENDTLQFIQTAEGRVVPKTVDGVNKNEYQYHLKDHLGNVRTTFAVRDDEYASDFETAENPYFDNYDEITVLSNPLKRSGNYAHRLTGGGTDIVGLMKTLSVSKGDKVSAEVYGKYLDAPFTDESINGAALISALVGMLGGGTMTGEGTVVQNNLNTDFLSAAMADGSEEQSPKAYLNYIMLDQHFNYLNSGFERLAASAADPGDGTGAHQKLSFESIAIEEEGYLMVFVSNESEQQVEVFWDDFRVDHHYNAVLQADDYYPFGLTFNSYQRSYSKANNYKYQGEEEVPEMGVGVYDFHARMYDATLGRTFQIDPLAEKFMEVSPYSWVMNNPMINIDPTGMSSVTLTGDDARDAFQSLSNIYGWGNNNETKDNNDNGGEKNDCPECTQRKDDDYSKRLNGILNSDPHNYPSKEETLAVSEGWRKFNAILGTIGAAFNAPGSKLETSILLGKVAYDYYQEPNTYTIDRGKLSTYEIRIKNVERVISSRINELNKDLGLMTNDYKDMNSTDEIDRISRRLGQLKQDHGIIKSEIKWINYVKNQPHIIAN